MDRSRRILLAALSSATAVYGLPAVAMEKGSTEPYADQAVTDQWLQQVLALGAAKGALHLGRFADRTYFTTKTIGWKPNPGQTGPHVDVPTGFVTDFASIPRVFWSALPPDGQYTYPAILHDYLYWEQSIERGEADRVLQLAMGDFRVPRATIEVIYRAVRLGGWSAWNSNKELKSSGERRFLKKYPDDPTIRWNDWKTRPGVLS